MPINSCFENGKPGYRWGERGKCYTYTANDKKSMQEAKNKANLQGVAARINGYKEKSNNAAQIIDKKTDKEIYDMLRTVSIDTRSFMKDNMKKMINDHLTMKSWHEVSAKTAAEQMQDHIKAAAWHDSQINIIKGMITEVPLDPEKKSLSIPAGGASSVPASRKEKDSAREVPLDPKTLRKNDLVDMLLNHEEQYGKFDISVEDVANFLFEK